LANREQRTALIGESWLCIVGGAGEAGHYPGGEIFQVAQRLAEGDAGVVTETLSSQPTLLTTSAQMLVVVTTDGTADGASVASTASVSLSDPVHAAANSTAATVTTNPLLRIRRRVG